MAIRRPPTTFSDSITGADLASDIAISTTGNIATTGSGALTVAGNTTLSGTNNLGSNPTVTLGSNATFPTGHVIQTVIDSDTTTYSNTSVGDDSNVSNGPVALSKAYSITPTSASNKIMIHFMIPQVRINLDKSGLYMRVYRKIGSGSYAELTEASGASGLKSSVFGNIDRNGDVNRISTSMAGHVTDQTHGQSGVEVSYKFYFGVGDTGTHAVYVNRTEGDNNSTYNFRTRTHCTLQEIKG